MDQAAIRLECSRSQMGEAMHTSRCLFFLLVLVLHVMVVEGSVAQASACLTNRDTASLHVQAVTRIVTTGDAARLVQQGIPYSPARGRFIGDRLADLPRDRQRVQRFGLERLDEH